MFPTNSLLSFIDYHSRKSVYTSTNTSQLDQNLQSNVPFVDHRLSKSCVVFSPPLSSNRSSSFCSYDEHNHGELRYRSMENATVPVSSSIKYRSTTQLDERSPPTHRHQPKIMRTHSRTYSSSSNELNQVSIITPRSLHEVSDDDNEQTNLFLRRKYPQTHHEQQIPPSSSVKYASNGVLLRPKQPSISTQHAMNVLPTSSDDMSKRFKRFSLDQQQTIDSNVYRSSMAIVPNHQNTPTVRDEMINDIQQQQQRAKVCLRKTEVH